MTHEEAKALGATHYRKILFFTQYFKQPSENGFWYIHDYGFWVCYDSEKPWFSKPL